MPDLTLLDEYDALLERATPGPWGAAASVAWRSAPAANALARAAVVVQEKLWAIKDCPFCEAWMTHRDGCPAGALIDNAAAYIEAISEGKK